MMDRVAFLAPKSPPDTGASRAWIPDRLSFSQILMARSGLEVVISMTRVPFPAWAKMPSSPRYTCSTSDGYPTMVMMAWHFWLRALTESSQTAPFEIDSAAFVFVRV